MDGRRTGVQQDAVFHLICISNPHSFIFVVVSSFAIGCVESSGKLSGSLSCTTLHGRLAFSFHLSLALGFYFIVTISKWNR